MEPKQEETAKTNGTPPKKPSLLTGTLIGAGIGAGFGAIVGARAKPSELINNAIATAALEVPGGGLLAATAADAVLNDERAARRVVPQWQRLMDQMDRHQNHTLLMTTVLCSALGAVTGFVITKLHHRDAAQELQRNEEFEQIKNDWVERVSAREAVPVPKQGQMR